MTIDPVPHHLADEATDLPEAIDAIELGLADGDLVPALLEHEPSIAAPVIRLSAARSQAGLCLHSLHQQLEVTRGQVEVEIEFAEVVELQRVDGRVTGIKGLDHTRANTSPPTILAAHDPDEVEAFGVLSEDRGRRVA